MKKLKLKNAEIQSKLNLLNALKGIVLDGKDAKIIIKAKNAIEKEQSEYTESRKMVVEGFCTKEEDGSPKSTVKQLENGMVLTSYEFDSPEIENDCAKKIFELDQAEVEIEIGIIEEEKTDNIKCTNEQMEALMLFAP